jgi:ligand-binding SRPBCC domain-containing protein
MAKYVLKRMQLIPGDLASVFHFFEDPHNLRQITPRWLYFRVVSSTDESVRLGTEIQYRIHWFGFPMKWESRITAYEKDVMFADSMIAGPYKSWVHTHRFREVPGGVEMKDCVEYRMPLGLLGALAHSVIVRRQLNAIFDFRARQISNLFPSRWRRNGR